MLNRVVSSWRQNRKQSGQAGYTSKTSSQTKGIHKHWRSILCICAESYTDADYHTVTREDVPNALGRGTLWAVSNGARPKETIMSRDIESAWFEKTRRGPRPCSEPGAGRQQRKRRSVRTGRGREGCRSYDDDLHYHMAHLQLITSNTSAATGERIQATPTTSKDDTEAGVLKSANPLEGELGGAQAAEKLSSSRHEEEWPKKQEEPDPEWEALKKRVLYLEEHGNSPLETGEAERALRGLRAQIRQGWAEEELRMRARAREERTRSTKKLRRNAGWWTFENGNLLRCTVTYSDALKST